MRTLKVNIVSVICAVVILLQLLWQQYNKFGIPLSGGSYMLVYYMKYVGSFALFFYSLTMHRDNEMKKRFHGYLRILAPLFTIMFFFEFAAVISGSNVISTYGVSYWTRTAALFLDKISILVMVAAMWYLRGKKAIDFFSSVLILDGILLIVVDIIKNGFLPTMSTFFLVFGLTKETAATSALEVHEATFCIGLCIIYLLFFEDKRKKENKIRLIVMALLFILGNKRIGFGGIAVSGLFSLFVHKKGLRRLNVFVVGSAGCLICLAYVALCYSGDAMKNLVNIEIDVMGRDTIYQYFVNRTTFSPAYTGWGLSSVSKVIANMSRLEVGNMTNVRGLHNDILKIYIEYGFVGSLCWYIFNLVSIPLGLFNRFGKKDATLYIALAIFAFITYLTDNTENYFMVQVVLLLIPLVAGSKQEDIALYEGGLNDKNAEGIK